jgi:hypothetical protein
MNLSAICFGGLSTPGPSGDVSSLNNDSDSVQASDKTVKCVAPKNYIEQLIDLATFVQKCFTLSFFHFHRIVTVMRSVFNRRSAARPATDLHLHIATGVKSVCRPVYSVLEQGTSVVGTS